MSASVSAVRRCSERATKEEGITPTHVKGIEHFEVSECSQVIGSGGDELVMCRKMRGRDTLSCVADLGRLWRRVPRQQTAILSPLEVKSRSADMADRMAEVQTEPG